MEKSIIEKTNKIIKGRSIFLIGMMASGKSQTGPVLAKLLSYKYIDLDKLIEKISKKSINEIFQENGFPDLEWFFSYFYQSSHCNAGTEGSL